MQEEMRDGHPAADSEPAEEKETTKAVTALRAALRAAQQSVQAGAGPAAAAAAGAAVETAAQPLIRESYRPLLHYCAALLLRLSPRIGAQMEAEDLAQEAWRKSLQYLAGPSGDRVETGLHFARLLRRVARTSLLDTLDAAHHAVPTVEMDAPTKSYRDSGGSAAGTRGERLTGTAASQRSPESLLLPRDGKYLRLVEELFTDPEGFHRRYRQQNQRQPHQYQALALYQIAMLAHEQQAGTASSGGGDAGMMYWIRHHVALLGISEPLWRRVEQAVARSAERHSDINNPAEESDPDMGILEAVNEICGTRLRTRAHLSVLRHEMNRFAETM